MYETEANTKVESVSDIPQDVVAAFGSLNGEVLSRTTLPWSEHCTECVWPTCYSTCEFYTPRLDGRCRRFVDGMVRIECPAAINGYLIKVRFKRWGKLWSPGTVRLVPSAKAQTLERRDYVIGTLLHQWNLPLPIKRVLTTRRYGFKKKVAIREADREEWPTSFILECYNPSSCHIGLSLTMRPAGETSKIPFQELIKISPGFHRIRLPIDRIMALIKVEEPFGLEIVPNDNMNETTLYFGLMDFVKEKKQLVEKNNAVKCVVWDLDNTLWDGTLVEDGEARLRLKPEVVDVIRTLDARGILHSIASKNNREDALRVLQKFQVDKYFLCPQISWQPKSESIKAVASQLNIGSDSLLFIDDSDFELEQVKAVHPEVRIVNARYYESLIRMEECQVAVTSEGRDRRKLYQMECARRTVKEGFGNDYFAFLRDCQIELNVESLKDENLERVHELTQRTNQMNFSGNRYSREVLAQILSTPHLSTFVLSCGDRFGAYGVVGFCIVDDRKPLMTDLMFSCRIQSKRIEHAFLAYLIKKYASETGKDFHAYYRKTARNSAAGKVFADMGMEEIEAEHGLSLLVFSKDRQIPSDNVVRVNCSE